MIGRISGWIILGFTIFLAAGCGGGGGGGGSSASGTTGNTGTTSSSSPTITLQTSKSNVFADGRDSSLITATFSAPPPAGEAVTFTVSAGTATLSAGSAMVTTVNGVSQASVTVTSAVAGIVTVTGSAGSSTASANVTFVNDMAVNASKTTVLADGSDSAAITAQFPAATSPADGSLVSFTVVSGAGTLNSDVAPVYSGKATVYLTGTAVGPVTVQASYAGVSHSVDVTFYSISLAASKISVFADGNDSALITASFLAPPPPGETVTFAVSSGTATLSAASAVVTTVNGVSQASVFVKSTAAGAVTLTGTVGRSTASVNVTFVNDMTVNTSNATVLVGGSTAITAQFPAASPPADGSLVSFRVASGTGTLNSASAAVSGGKATVYLTGTAIGPVTVQATYAGVTHSVDVTFYTSLTVSANRSLALANGTDAVTVTVSLPASVPDGTPVSFAVTSGTATLGSATAPASGGSASATVTSGTAGSVTVTATCLGASTGSTTFRFVVQPVTAVVDVALDQPVSNLLSLAFLMDNSGGVTLTSATAINEGAVGTVLFDPPAIPNSNKIAFADLSLTPFTTVAGKPIIELTYAVSSGIPQFTVDTLNGVSATTFTASGPPNTLNLLPSDLLVTVTYKDGSGNSL